MKKVKFTRRKKKKKIFNKSKLFLLIICLMICLTISVIIILLLFFIRLRAKKIVENEVIDFDKVLYKGFKIEKTTLLKDFLSRVSGDDKKFDREKERFIKYFNLPEYSNNPKAQIDYKNNFFDMFSKMKKKPINKIETFFIEQRNNFGNWIITLNNNIFYCEIIGCHKIIVKEKKALITKQIYLKNLNITIIPGSNINCNDDTTICIRKDFFYSVILKPQIRIQYIKEEILNNLPLVIIDANDLYIHLRGGDIFKRNPSPYYSQPPLCFYEKIINNNKFKNIYIISMDKRNIILNSLIKKHKDIIFKQNDDIIDISLLAHAFNIVSSMSSFLISTIKLNDNLKNFWEYDIACLSEKFLFLHHDLYKFDIKYNIYTMKSSDIYANEMFIWKNSENQRKLMLEDTCPYDFVLTKPNI